MSLCDTVTEINLGILSDIVSNIQTRQGQPSVGGGIMDNFRNTSQFTTEDLVNPSQNNLMPIPDQVALNAMQRNTFGNFGAGSEAGGDTGGGAGGGALPIEGATTDPFSESESGKDKMYGVPGAAAASAGMGGGRGSISSNIGIGGGFTGGAPLKTYSDYADPLFSLDPADSALLGLTGPNPNALGNVKSDLANAIAAAEAADTYGASMPNEGIKGIIDKLSGMVKDPSLTKETKDRALEQLMEEFEKRENTQAAESGSPGVSSKGYGAQGKTSEKAEGLVSIPGALAAFSINPAAYLYGGAGSSFESGRNEYTESGQYDIDKAARDAEFDAMREQARIDAGLPYKRLTPEETQQAVLDQRAAIGADFRTYLDNVQAPDTTGAYDLGVANRAAASEAYIPPGEGYVDSPLYTGESDPYIQEPLMGLPSLSSMRRRGGGRRARMNQGGVFQQQPMTATDMNRDARYMRNGGAVLPYPYSQ